MPGLNSDQMQRMAANAASSLRILFTGVAMDSASFAGLLSTALRTLSGGASGEVCAEALNRLSSVCQVRSFVRQLDALIFERLGALCGSAFSEKPDKIPPDALFHYQHAVRLAEICKTLFPAAAEKINQEIALQADSLPLVRPSAAHLDSVQSSFLRMKLPALGAVLEQQNGSADLFASSRIFRHHHGTFTPLNLPGIRKVEEFYGYQSARRMFYDHFEAFSQGKENWPLLISSLPGLGKTQMTIAYARHFPDIVLIVPDPDDISHGLEDLVNYLTPITGHKFMIFFDDIDVNQTDWYYFRTNIGGTFSLPPHIAVTVASNQAFPANISSRGRGFTFPMFDEIRCQEMILDFLLAKGMHDPKSELVSVIAADYVSEFGQKKFEELSPRTLVRYLDHFLSDQAKRRLLLETASGKVIPQPDPQVFYEENVKLMCAIHGPGVMEQFRKEALHV